MINFFKNSFRDSSEYGGVGKWVSILEKYCGYITAYL